MNELPKNNGQEQPRTPEEKVSRTHEILGFHIDRIFENLEATSSKLSKKDEKIVMEGLPFLEPNIRDLVYVEFPTIARQALVEMTKKLKETGNKSLSDAYDLLHIRASTESDALFTGDNWKLIEDAWPDLDQDIQKCARVIFPKLSLHLLRFEVDQASTKRTT